MIRFVRYRSIEFVVALMLILWGVWVANPFWELFTASPVFGLMAHIGPEPAWGVTVFAVGCLQMGFVFSRQWTARRATAVLSLFVYVLLSVMFGLGNFRGVSTVIYAVFALLCWFAYVNIPSKGDRP